MSVRAPHNSSLLTASVSAAMMAKKRTGMGTLDMLGSAPRSNNSFMVLKRTRCLDRREHNTSNLQRGTQTKQQNRTEQTAQQKRGQN